MQLAFTQSYPAAPSDVASLLRNEEFIVDVANHAGAVDHAVRIDGNRTELDMEIPSPENVQKMIGKTVKLALTMQFEEARPDGVVPGRVTVKVPGAPVDAFADATLAPGGEGTVGTYDGEIKVKIPLVGKKAEAQIEPFVVRAFNGIERRARVWLTK